MQRPLFPESETMHIRNIRRQCRHLLAASAAAIILPAAPALAKTGPNDAPDEDPQVQADAATTAHADASIDILVTARRRAEASQDVPLAISVVAGEALANTGAFNVGRLQQLTPTV